MCCTQQWWCVWCEWKGTCIYLLPTGRGDISLFFLLMGDRDGERDSSRLPLPLPLRIGDLDPPRLSLCTGLREAKLRRLKMGERERDLLLCREGKTPDTHISPTYMYLCTYTHTSHSLTLTLSHCLSLSHSQSHSLSLSHTHTHTPPWNWRAGVGSLASTNWGT